MWKKIVEPDRQQMTIWDNVGKIVQPDRQQMTIWDNVEKYCRAGQATDDNMG